MKKRIVSILLAVVMIVGMLPLGVITAFAEVTDTAVPFLNWSETEKKLYEDSVTDYTPITSDSLTVNSSKLYSGWYVVKDEVTFTGFRIIAEGDVHLILCDGAKLTADTGINVGKGNSLTVYGQTNGTGELIATGQYHRAGIGGSYATGAADDSPSNSGNITINGGKIRAQGADYAAGIGGGIYGVCGKVTINGGDVTAIGGQYCAGITNGSYAAKGVDLNISDNVFIFAGKTEESAKHLSIEEYKSNIAIGTGDNDQKYVWITQDPYTVTQSGIDYIDPTNDIPSQSADKYIALDVNTDLLNSRISKNVWFVVNKNITIPNRITVGGNVNLILCDGAKLTASKGISVPSGNSLTIYGQENGTGELIATADSDYYAGIGGDNGVVNGHVTNNGNSGSITVNGGKIRAQGGFAAAGIGGGIYGVCGSVTVNGGDVTAIGGFKCAGITNGSGAAVGTNLAICDNMLIFAGNTENSMTVIPLDEYKDNIDIVEDHNAQKYVRICDCKHEGKAPNCTESGYETYYEYDGNYYEDSALSREITDLDAWLSVDGDGYRAPNVHKWKFCTGEDYLYHKCENCDAKEAHTLDSEGECACGYHSHFLEIHNAEEYNVFAEMAENDEDFSGKTVLLMDDISVDMRIYSFNGIFDGCGHTINLRNDYKDLACLFGDLNGATMKNLTVSGNTNIAGFANKSVNSAFINCTNLCMVSAGTDASGFVSNAENCSFINCINRGDNYSTDMAAAGFSATIYDNTKFINCASIGKIEGNSAYGIGNVVGNANITLSNIYIGGSINGSKNKYLLTDENATVAENIYALTGLEGVTVEENVTPTYTPVISEVLAMLNEEATKHDDWYRWGLDKNGELILVPYAHHPAVVPTCTEAGSLEYFEYNGKFYSDSELSQEIPDIDAWISVGGDGHVQPNGHNFENGECTVCGKKNHYGKYIVRSWNEETKTVDETEADIPDSATEITNTTTTLSGGCYVLVSDVDFDERITVTGTAQNPTNIILMDGYTLSAENGINVGNGKVLNIYGQSGDSGKITATGNENNAGIGSNGADRAGTLMISGGTVEAIGGMVETGSMGVGYYEAAGIGGGYCGNGGTVIINGGTVTATGGVGAAGIGGGQSSDHDTNTGNGGTVTVNGGTVTVNGGTVTAIGGSQAAGIGGGCNSTPEMNEECGKGGTVTVNGGYINAKGGEYAAGIGGGLCGNGGDVTVCGGSVNVIGGEYSASAIGAGLDGMNHGSLTVPNENNTVILAGKDADNAVVITAEGFNAEIYFYVQILSGVSYTAAKAATCTESGTLGYFVCEGGYYADSNLSQKITDIVVWLAPGGDGYVPALGGKHEWVCGTWKDDQYHICKKCGKKEKHTLGESGVCTVCRKKESQLLGKYILRSWNEETKKVEECEKDIPKGTAEITKETATLEGGWYVLASNVEIGSRITVTGTAQTPTNIILMDGYTLSAEKGINVAKGKVLNIYGQKYDSGKITATAKSWYAGIGGSINGNGGTVTVYGGTVTATGGSGAAGIGGGAGGAGIGTSNGGHGGTFTVYGGTVTATGGSQAPVIGEDAGIGSGGAGIGGGLCGEGGTATVYGGTVTTTGGVGAAGIGCNLHTQKNSLSVTICGGTVTATGGVGAAGIGVSSSGNSGFGDGNGGIVIINGGSVTATGGDGGAGIGGGYGGAGGSVTVYSGAVTAIGGEGGAGIGGGSGGGDSFFQFVEGGVRATGGVGAAGIGAGANAKSTVNIIISDTANTTFKAGDTAADSVTTAYEYDKPENRNRFVSIVKCDHTSIKDFICESCGQEYPEDAANDAIYAIETAKGNSKDAVVILLAEAAETALLNTQSVAEIMSIRNRCVAAIENLTGTTHEHTFADTYTFDENHHWYACTCEDDACKGLTSGFGLHAFDGGQQTDNVIVYTCADCGYQKTVYTEITDIESELITGTIKYKAVSLTLSDDIYLNFYMDITPEAAEGGKMVFIIGGRTVEAKAQENENGYYFACPVNVLEMAVDVIADFTYGGKTVEARYSVQKYVDAILAGNFNDTMKTLARKISNYGYYTQLYLAGIHDGVTIGNEAGNFPAAKHFDGAFEVNTGAWSLKDGYVSPTVSENDTVKPYGRSVLFDSTMAINFYVTTTDNKAPTAVCADESKTVTVKKSGDQYRVTVHGIKTSELATPFTVTVNGIDFTCSVLDYCAAVFDSNGADSAAARSMAALYEYYTAARTYAASK